MRAVKQAYRNRDTVELAAALDACPTWEINEHDDYSQTGYEGVPTTWMQMCAFEFIRDREDDIREGDGDDPSGVFRVLPLAWSAASA